MRIVVCIKQVPDTTEVKLDPKTNTLIREGVPSIINPDDKAGLEAALRLREQVGGTVTVLCMGPPQADVALREALAMGCDEAVLLSAREFGGSDTWATASIIAAGLNKIGYDQASKQRSEVREFMNGSFNATLNRIKSDDNIQTELGEFGIINKKYLPDEDRYSDYQKIGRAHV